ncbi:hypothetical protein PHLGIDRAFT_131162 [Phlebiopsis gigantea 11061_1 CR5-6]|uniref:Uncharacterized protein n=1 Tax=Phlebiopsis gigantea (strain 11061_1 CR5-6) TaxID=745531 RepID=A0A0C3PA59_PHLG1|nr:hypothetical protein PHLGIDRAFT_131162 [Phlebiopsis gigantea 11061_1 CR5-6]
MVTMTATAPEPTRYSSAIRDTSLKPSAPIPIPNLRRVTNPPPRSPTRCFDTASDLIFEMSPHVGLETPLTQYRDLAKPTYTTTHHARKPLTLSSRYGQPQSPPTERPPYWEEPFLYSVPRLPPRLPLQQSRTHSARLNRTRSIADEEDLLMPAPSSYPSSPSFDSLGPGTKPVMNDPSVAKAVHVLTSAFQQSFSSSTSSTQSFQSSLSPHIQFKESLTPSKSIHEWDTPQRYTRASPSRHRRSLTKSNGISGVIRTSAAEPVVSFAQAELKHSPSSGVITRVVKVTRTTPTCSLRAKSPYPVTRGRRGSALRNTTPKTSGESLAGTRDRSRTSEKFGLEKFLLRPFPRGRGVDENAHSDEDENIERGRTRSRARGGRRP